MLVDFNFVRKYTLRKCSVRLRLVVFCFRGFHGSGDSCIYEDRFANESGCCSYSESCRLYSSSIYLIKDGRRANAKSLLGVMSLGIEIGASVQIEAEGEDADKAVSDLIEYLQNPKF